MKKNNIITNTLELTLYTKGNGTTWYCDYYFYNGRTYERGTTRAAGYGYDKHSTALSNAINHFNHLFTFKTGIKWDDMEHATRNNRTFYGCYKDKSISYGIGAASVLNCIGLFANVKLTEQHYGKYEDFFKLEILTSPEQLKKELDKLDKAHAKEQKAAKSNDYLKYINKKYKEKKQKLIAAIEQIEDKGE